MRRYIVGTAVIVILVGAGVVVETLAGSSSNASSQTSSGLNTLSTWSGKIGTEVRVYSGSTEDNPHSGVVLVETAGENPVIFSAPAGTGPFRLISHWNDGWVFRARDGSVAVVEAGLSALQKPPTFAFLGKPLDPAHLGPIAKDGVAVPVQWGMWSQKTQRYAKSAVVLVQQVKNQWKPYGYLPGYWIPRRTTQGDPLGRPLVAPNGTAYLVDPQHERLVRDKGVTGSVAPGYALGTKFGKCATWAIDHDYSYQACPNVIKLETNGTTRTLFHRNLGKETSEWSWNLVRPSPNGKWLLVEDTSGFCGNPTWADFLPARGGSLQSAFPGSFTSEALGWLPGNSALIGAQPQDCTGASAGIYEVWPQDPSHMFDPNLGATSQVVFGGPVDDATTWGFGR